MAGHGVVCFEEQERNKQPFVIPAFYSRASSLLIPPVDAEIRSEVVFLQIKQPPPRKSAGMICFARLPLHGTTDSDRHGQS